MDMKNIDPQELAEKLAEAINAATKMAEAVGLVQAIMERSFDKETLDAIYFVMSGPDAVAKLPAEERISTIDKACTTIERYHALITCAGSMQ